MMARFSDSPIKLHHALLVGIVFIAAFTRLWLGPVSMSPEDHAADLAAIAQQKEYGSTGNEECAIYRYIGRSPQPRST